jgi:hypothetical protein
MQDLPGRGFAWNERRHHRRVERHRAGRDGVRRARRLCHSDGAARGGLREAVAACEGQAGSVLAVPTDVGPIAAGLAALLLAPRAARGAGG